jgi:RNA polymerase sigma factor (sigma-70 family)
MNDWQLLKSYGCDDSQDAFTEIVRRHVNLVYSAALRQVREAELAKDVTQLVFSNLARRAKSLKPSGTLAGWLHRDACYTSLDVLRRERRRVAREQEAVAMQEIETETSNDWRRIQPGLDSALRQLGQTERDAVLLRFFEQLSLKEVGSALGLEEDAARKRVSRALEKLRSLLARQGITTTSAALSLALTTHAVQAAPAGLAAGVLATSLAAGSTAAGASAWTFIEMLTMTKIKATIATAALVACLGTPLILQHQTNKSLREQNEILISQTTRLDALKAENQRLSNRLVQAPSNGLSDQEKLELLRLRGEVAGLRADASQAEKKRQEINRLRSARGETAKARPQEEAVPRDSFPRETWAFAGYASPESAVQSFAWAALQGDMNTFLNSLSPEKQMEEREKWQKDTRNETQIRDGLVKEFGRTKAIHIDERRTLSDSEILLSLSIEREKGDFERVNMKVQRIDNQWKLAGPQEEDESRE